MRYKALLIDDDPDLAGLVRAWFKKRAQSLMVCDSGRQALAAARESKPDVILLDVRLGDADGREVCRQLKADRALKGVPVLMVSASLREQADMVAGLRCGADDYMLKDFSEDLLFAKMEALLRRSGPAEASDEVLSQSGLAVNTDDRSVTLGGKALRLTRKEFDLLTIFLRRKGRVLTPRYLLETVWGYEPSEYNDPHTVRVHVYHLKRKLGGGFAKRLKTVIGVGYKLA